MTDDSLLETVYDELRKLAQKHLADERAGHTLQATALVNEAFLRVRDQLEPNTLVFGNLLEAVVSIVEP